MKRPVHDAVLSFLHLKGGATINTLQDTFAPWSPDIDIREVINTLLKEPLGPEIERTWAMPNKWTFLIPPFKQLLNEEMHGRLWVDPFAGKNSPATLTNDLNSELPASSHLDAVTFLEGLPTHSADGVLYDPPYSITQAKTCYDGFGGDKLKIGVGNMAYWSSCKDEIARIIKPGGKAICFGWNSMGLGKKRGFWMTRVLICSHGGSRNDTICTVERSVWQPRP